MISNKESIHYPRVVFILTGLVLGVLVLVFGTKVTTGNSEALWILVTVFSILAGIMIAVVTAIGNPEDLYKGSWRIASLHRRQKLNLLTRYTLLFYVYLVVVSLAFISTLLGKIVSHSELIQFVERATISLGVAALFWSFGLPIAILRTQKDKLDEEVEKRKTS